MGYVGREVEVVDVVFYLGKVDCRPEEGCVGCGVGRGQSRKGSHTERLQQAESPIMMCHW